MPAAPITLAQLRPFVAPVLLESSVELEGQQLLTRMRNEMTTLVRGTGSKDRRIVRITDIDADGALLTQALVYRETGTPSWLTTDALEDVGHEYIVVSVRGSNATLCASDAVMRDRIVKKIRAVRRLSRDAITAFVGDEARALWLNGVHTPTAAKADTKALTGVDLGYSLDPIGDQSYYFSAVRSLPGVPGLAQSDGRPMLVGAAPAGGRIWMRRAESLDDYKALINAALDHATAPREPRHPFQALALPVGECRGCRRCLCPGSSARGAPVGGRHSA